MESKLTKEYDKIIKHMEKYNALAPFPVFDTEYVKDIIDKNKTMKEDEKNYDSEPVVACRYCKSLHIEYDENGKDLCMRCGSNELTWFENIHKYLDFKNDRK